MKQKIFQSAILAFLFLGMLTYTNYGSSTVKSVNKASLKKVKKRSQCDNVTISNLSFTNSGNTSITLSFTITGYYTSLNYGGYWNAVNGYYPFPSGAVTGGNSQTVYVPYNTGNIVGGRIGITCGCADGSSVGAHGALFNLPNATNYGYPYPYVSYF